MIRKNGYNFTQDYQLPYHPLININNNLQYPLIDLTFFYLQRYFHEQIITYQFVNKIMQSKVSDIKNRPSPLLTQIFNQFKDYFLLRSTGLLLCQTDISNDDQLIINRITQTIIRTYLLINRETTQLNPSFEIFLSTIILKRSWNYLFYLLKSEHLDNQWTDTLSTLLQTNQINQHNQYLQYCHKIQFTLSINNTSSIFPHLHQPYQQLRNILADCINQNLDEQRWKLLLDWIQTKLNPNTPSNLQLNEIKVMLLLNIYYDYYSNNQLTSLNTLLPIIENTLQPLPEELRVFRAFLYPEKYIIGYSQRHDNEEINFLNQLFSVDCKDEDELCIRHCLVNLLAMILMGNKQSFLWTFAFNPLALQNTFGKLSHLIKLNIYFLFSIRFWFNSTSNNSNKRCSL